jgi:hypothetical protein
MRARYEVEDYADPKSRHLLDAPGDGLGLRRRVHLRDAPRVLASDDGR